MRVEVVRQSQTPGACGPTSVAMLLSSIGLNRSPLAIMTAAGVDPTSLSMHGSRPDELARGVSDIATLVGKYGTSLGDVKQVIASGTALAIEWQGRFRNEAGGLFEQGHYSVICGVDAEVLQVHIIDPEDNSVMQQGGISFVSLLPRWWEDNSFHGPGDPPRRGYGLALAISTEENTHELRGLGFERVTYDWCVERTIEVIA